MRPLDQDKLTALDSEALASRIDEFFREDHASRYGHDFPRLNITTAEEILATRALQTLPEESRKRALGLFYRAQFQSELCMRHSGLANLHVHQNESDTKWESASLQILYAATRQAQIVAARISFECLMEFVYFVEERRLIPSNKSKRSKFREWCCGPSNRFGWLVFYLLVIEKYDREHRSREVHGTSYIAIDAIRCVQWPRNDSELDALNLMLNIWRFIVQTLNGDTALGCSPGRHEELFREFFNWKNIDLAAFWKSNT
jgi:hypothetical protein